MANKEKPKTSVVDNVRHPDGNTSSVDPVKIRKPPRKKASQVSTSIEPSEESKSDRENGTQRSALNSASPKKDKSAAADDQINIPRWSISRGVTWLEKNPIPRLAAMLAGTYTLFVVWQTAGQINVDLADREQDRIDGAIARLLTRASGDTGKGAALNILFSKDFPIAEYNLGCQAIEELTPKRMDTECGDSPTFRGVSYVPKPPGFISTVVSYVFGVESNYKRFMDIKIFQGVKFRGSKIINSTIKYQWFRDVDFSQVSFERVNLNYSIIEGNLKGASYMSSDLTGSTLVGDTTYSLFFMTNVSNTSFGELERLFNFNGSFAWADALPRYKNSEFSQRSYTNHPPAWPVEKLEVIRLCAPPTVEGRVQPLWERAPPSNKCDEVPPLEARARMWEAEKELMKDYDDKTFNSIAAEWGEAGR